MKRTGTQPKRLIVCIRNYLSAQLLVREMPFIFVSILTVIIS